MAVVVVVEVRVRRRRKEGVVFMFVLVGVEERVGLEGVLKGVVAVVVVLLAGGEAWKSVGWVVRRLLGVTAGIAITEMAVVDREGVPAERRSKRPSTRPSFWGVGLTDVGTAGMGVRAVRFTEGVRTGPAAADGVRAPGDIVVSGWKCWVLVGVWAGLDLLEGVWGARAASDWVRLRCRCSHVAWGGILPASMSRILLYRLYLWAVACQFGHPGARRANGGGWLRTNMGVLFDVVAARLPAVVRGPPLAFPSFQFGPQLQGFLLVGHSGLVVHGAVWHSDLCDIC